MNPKLQLIFREVMQAFQAGDMGSADLILKNLLQTDIENTDAIFELGNAYAKVNKFAEALAIFSCLQNFKNSDVKILYNLALIYAITGRHQLALEAYDLVLKIQPNDVEALINKGSVCNDIKNYSLALEVLEKAIQIRSDIPEAWSNKGIALNNLNLYEDSIDAYNKAVEINSDYAEAWSNKSAPLNKLKRFKEALEVCNKALSLRPDYVEAISNKGSTLKELKHYDEALAQFDKALALKSDYVEAWLNKGVVLDELKRYSEAIAHYDRALNLRPDYVEAISNKGNALKELKYYDEAINHFDKALFLRPDYAEVWSNKGVTLNELKRYSEAIGHYDRAIALKPDYVEAWLNKGATLDEIGYYNEAIEHYDKALSLEPDYAEAWSNMGNTLTELKRYGEAIAHYDRALKLKPSLDWVFGNSLHIKMKIASWLGAEDAIKVLSQKILQNEKVSTPFALLSLIDDALLQKKSSEIYAQEKHSFNNSLGQILKRPKKKKIRIGYFSADFRNHPVGLLTSELFEIHDRDRFEVFAFSLKKALPNDVVNLRLQKGFDRYMEVEQMPDMELAKLARELEIEIAVDLSGLTQSSRTGIFSYRAAPIQVNWLGYPGTIGADFIDYIVADRVVIPEAHQQFYSEKVAYLPNTYMVDDSTRTPSSRIFTRSECGLPEDGFVFCSFNSEYKFNSRVLDSWSKILLAVEKSILWIPENNEFFEANILSEFESRGIKSSRIIFAKRMDLMEDHLARYNLANLFLDTYPYNAHTTAVDSLKSGIPVLTLIGRSFASRVAASILNAIGLPELVTNTREEYESLAIELAMNPKKYADLKLKLANNRLTTPLFDTPLFAKNIEAAYIKMYERYKADLPPDHIFIE